MKFTRMIASIVGVVAFTAMAGTLAPFALVGCATREPFNSVSNHGLPAETIAIESPRKRPGYGPPPYGYWRILGGTVPRGAEQLEWANDTPAPMQWTFIGPRPVTSDYWSGENNSGGRVVSIACHPTSAATAYIASASGGIWKTLDFGANWTPLTDRQPNLNHGAVTLDKTFPETVYSGTGEYTMQSLGGGLFRSLDGGTNWTMLASAGTMGSRCSGIVVVSGSTALTPAVIHWTGNFGYKRSINGGTSWTTPISDSCSSLSVDPSNSQRVYVAVKGIGISRSVNGGVDFTTLSGGLPVTGFGRIVLAQSISTPDVLYAVFVDAASTSGLLGLYRTGDGGGTWTKLVNTPNFPFPQGWYDISIGVDPTNSNHLYCGGVRPSSSTLGPFAGVIESTNAGQSWTEISGSGGQIHPDQQCIAFGADNTPWFGCDGGVWRRVGSTWSNCNATLCAIQNYTISEHPNNANRVMTGTQDVGSAGTSSGAIAWPQIVSGDGGYGAYLQDVYTTLFTTYIYLEVYRTTGTSAPLNISGPWSDDPREWISPLVTDANGGLTLYGGTNRLWRNTASTTSSSWTAVSTTTISNGGTVTAIATVAGAPGVIWIGNSNGGIWRTANAGTTWTSVRAPDNVRINGISTRPGNALTACILRGTTTGARVYRTTNAASWTSLTGTLPTGVSGNALAVDWDRGIPTLFVGSGAGIYASFNNGSIWIKSGPDLPNVNIGQMEINRTRRTIVTGTYGRGAWRSPLAQRADFDLSGVVDAADLSVLLGSWGSCSVLNCDADMDGSGVVDGADLAALLSEWGA